MVTPTAPAAAAAAAASTPLTTTTAAAATAASGPSSTAAVTTPTSTATSTVVGGTTSILSNRKYLCAAPRPDAWEEYSHHVLQHLGRTKKERLNGLRETLIKARTMNPFTPKTGPGRKSNAEHAIHFYEYLLEKLGGVQEEEEGDDDDNDNGKDNPAAQDSESDEDDDENEEDDEEEQGNGKNQENEDEDDNGRRGRSRDDHRKTPKKEMNVDGGEASYLLGVNLNRDQKDKNADEGDLSSMDTEQFNEQHNDLCEVCDEAGVLLMCSTCNLVFHLPCVRPVLLAIPKERNWRCAYCILSTEPKNSKPRRQAAAAVRLMARLRNQNKRRKARGGGGSISAVVVGGTGTATIESMSALAATAIVQATAPADDVPEEEQKEGVDKGVATKKRDSSSSAKPHDEHLRLDRRKSLDENDRSAKESLTKRDLDSKQHVADEPSGHTKKDDKDDDDGDNNTDDSQAETETETDAASKPKGTAHRGRQETGIADSDADDDDDESKTTKSESTATQEDEDSNQEAAPHAIAGVQEDDESDEASGGLSDDDQSQPDNKSKDSGRTELKTPTTVTDGDDGVNVKGKDNVGSRDRNSKGREAACNEDDFKTPINSSAVESARIGSRETRRKGSNSKDTGTRTDRSGETPRSNRKRQVLALYKLTDHFDKSSLPDMLNESGRGKRQRKQPILYDPQDGPAGQWQSDEWLKAQSSLSAECGETCEKTPESTEKRINDTGTRHGRDKPGGVVWCGFCGDDPSIKVCCFCACRVCFGKHHQSKLLLCDRCDEEYHTFCLRPPLRKVPKSKKWYCPTCMASDENRGGRTANRSGGARNSASPERTSPKKVAAPPTPVAASTPKSSSGSAKKGGTGRPRGRPPKNPPASTPADNRKRSSPPKSAATDSTDAPVPKRKRGRPPRIRSPDETTAAKKPSSSSSSAKKATLAVVAAAQTPSSSKRSTTAASSPGGSKSREGSFTRNARESHVSENLAENMEIESNTGNKDNAALESAAATASCSSATIRSESILIPVTLSRSGRTVKRTSFHDEIRQGDQHLRTTRSSNHGLVSGIMNSAFTERTTMSAGVASIAPTADVGGDSKLFVEDRGGSERKTCNSTTPPSSGTSRANRARERSTDTTRHSKRLDLSTQSSEEDAMNLKLAAKRAAPAYESGVSNVEPLDSGGRRPSITSPEKETKVQSSRMEMKPPPTVKVAPGRPDQSPAQVTKDPTMNSAREFEIVGHVAPNTREETEAPQLTSHDVVVTTEPVPAAASTPKLPSPAAVTSITSSSLSDVVEVVPSVVAMTSPVASIAAAVPPLPDDGRKQQQELVKVPRRKPGARECMQISRRFGVHAIPDRYMDILLDYCTRGKVEHLIRMRERLDEHARFLECQLSGLEALVQERGETDVVVPAMPVGTDLRDVGSSGASFGGGQDVSESS